MSPKNDATALASTSSSPAPIIAMVAPNGTLQQQPTILQQPQQLQPQQIMQLPLMQNMQQLPFQRLPVQYVQVPSCQPTIMQVPQSGSNAPIQQTQQQPQQQPMIVFNNGQPQQMFSQIQQQPAMQQMIPVAGSNGAISMQPYLPTFINNNNNINNFGMQMMPAPMMAMGGSNGLQQLQILGGGTNTVMAGVNPMVTATLEKPTTNGLDANNVLASQLCFCASQPNFDNEELGFFSSVSEVKDFLSKQTGVPLSSISTKIIEKDSITSPPSDPCVATATAVVDTAGGSSVIHRGSEDVVALVQRHRHHAIGCRRSYSLSGIVIWDGISKKIAEDARQHLEAAFNNGSVHFTEALSLCQCVNRLHFQSFVFGCTLNAEDGVVGGGSGGDGLGFCVFKDKPLVEKVPASFGGSAVAKSVVDSIDCIADQLSALATATLPKAALKRHAQLRESALECSWGTTSKVCGRLFSSAIGECKGSTHQRRIKRPMVGSAAASVNLGVETSTHFMPQFVFVEGDVDAAGSGGSGGGGGGRKGGMVGVAVGTRSVFITRADYWRSSNDNPANLTLTFYVESGLNKRSHGANSDIGGIRCSDNVKAGKKVNKGEKRKKDSKEKSVKSNLAEKPPQTANQTQMEVKGRANDAMKPEVNDAEKADVGNILEQCMDAIFGDTPLTISDEQESQTKEEENATNPAAATDAAAAADDDEDDDSDSIPTDDESEEDVDDSDSEDDMVDVETSEMDEETSANAASIVSRQNLVQAASHQVVPQTLQLQSHAIQLLQQQFPQSLQQHQFVNSLGKPILAVAALQHNNIIAPGQAVTPVNASILSQNGSISAGSMAAAAAASSLGTAANAPSSSSMIGGAKIEDISPADENDSSAIAAKNDTSSVDGDESIEEDANDVKQESTSITAAATAATASASAIAAKQRKTKCYLCPLCGKGYTGPYNMRRHVGLKHPEAEMPVLGKSRSSNDESSQRLTPPKKQRMIEDSPKKQKMIEANKVLGKLESPLLRRSKRQGIR